jgi:hypothetical protein
LLASFSCPKIRGQISLKRAAECRASFAFVADDAGDHGGDPKGEPFCAGNHRWRGCCRSSKSYCLAMSGSRPLPRRIIGPELQALGHPVRLTPPAYFKAQAARGAAGQYHQAGRSLSVHLFDIGALAVIPYVQIHGTSRLRQPGHVLRSAMYHHPVLRGILQERHATTMGLRPARRLTPVGRGWRSGEWHAASCGAVSAMLVNGVQKKSIYDA